MHGLTVVLGRQIKLTNCFGNSAFGLILVCIRGLPRLPGVATRTALPDPGVAPTRPALRVMVDALPVDPLLVDASASSELLARLRWRGRFAELPSPFLSFSPTTSPFCLAAFLACLKWRRMSSMSKKARSSFFTLSWYLARNSSKNSTSSLVDVCPFHANLKVQSGHIFRHHANHGYTMV